MIIISAFADEIAPDLPTQMDVCAANGVRCIDVRAIDGVNVSGMTADQAAAYNERLEARGFVTSRLGDPTPIRGGRRKRLYTLTPAGALALKASHEQLQSIAAGRVERLEEFLQKAGSR